MVIAASFSLVSGAFVIAYKTFNNLYDTVRLCNSSNTLYYRCKKKTLKHYFHFHFQLHSISSVDLWPLQITNAFSFHMISSVSSETSPVVVCHYIFITLDPACDNNVWSWTQKPILHFDGILDFDGHAHLPARTCNHLCCVYVY